ncbi:MAG: 2-amino-4-hydroxy-6-hydroxymethyldihydropteridine diphosphokinase [Polaromonas sp.]
MVTAYIALGANLGDAASALRQAVKALAQLPQTSLFKTSSIYKTAPLVSGVDEPGAVQHADLGSDYLNAVAEINTGLSAPALLQNLQQLEQAAGRERPYPNAPRTLDLDLLLYGSGRIESADLTVPHPRMWERAFVLVPLAEIAAGLVSDGQLKAVENQVIEGIVPIS